MIDFSIIIPALNESFFIEKTVNQVINAIPAEKEFEIYLESSKIPLLLLGVT